MRSLLFVPADGGAKLDKAMASGADAVILDLEDSIAPERKDLARKAALEFLKSASARKDRPRLLVRINGLDTGMTDADLDAVVAGKPDAILFPKAEGGATVTHLDAKLTAREAIAGLPEGAIKILAQTVKSAHRRCSPPARTQLQRAADRHDLGTGGPVGRARRGGQPRSRRRADRALSYRARHVPVRRGGGARCRRSKPSMSISATRTSCAAIPRSRAATVSPAGSPFIRRRSAVINEVFTPSAAQIEKAKAIVAAFAAKPGAGTVGIDGKMYDRPHLKRALALLARIGA